MLGKTKIKLINSLILKKYRNKYGLFIAEGEKLVFDFINNGMELSLIVANSTLNLNNKNIPDNAELIICETSDIKKITNLNTPTNIVALFKIPKFNLNIENINSELSLFCDDIQNPGNLGTIIRTADWFGIKNIICSENTVDIYNHKVVQATMGALTRVNINYVNKLSFFEKINNIPIYGTLLEGENIFETKLSKNGIIIIGNEGSGISEQIKAFITKKLLIPNYPKANNLAESLNASVATAIVCAEFRRRVL